ncbi:hypothetical protein S83_042117, partial [Arachis hypogaea]
MKKKYGYDHPMGDLTILCSEDKFLRINSRLNEMWIMLLIQSFPLLFPFPTYYKKNGESHHSQLSKQFQNLYKSQRVILQCMSEIIKKLSEVEEEFGYDHLMGGGYHLIPWEVSIPCSEH